MRWTVADQAGLGGTETASATATQTADYYVVVDSATGGSGCYQLTVQVQ